MAPWGMRWLADAAGCFASYCAGVGRVATGRGAPSWSHLASPLGSRSEVLRASFVPGFRRPARRVLWLVGWWRRGRGPGGSGGGGVRSEVPVGPGASPLLTPRGRGSPVPCGRFGGARVVSGGVMWPTCLRARRTWSYRWAGASGGPCRAPTSRRGGPVSPLVGCSVCSLGDGATMGPA